MLILPTLGSKKIAAISLGAIALLAGNYNLAAANKTKMICENPRREYLVIFDPEKHRFVVKAEDGLTKYRLRNVQNVPGGYVIKGSTIRNGPDFVAYTTGARRIEYFANFEKIQTDYCRKTK